MRPAQPALHEAVDEQGDEAREEMALDPVFSTEIYWTCLEQRTRHSPAAPERLPAGGDPRGGGAERSPWMNLREDCSCDFL